jgi:hypothetical protein
MTVELIISFIARWLGQMAPTSAQRLCLFTAPTSGWHANPDCPGEQLASAVSQAVADRGSALRNEIDVYRKVIPTQGRAG